MCQYLDFAPVTVDLEGAVFVAEGCTKSSGSSANKLLLLDTVDGDADAALRLAVNVFASSVFDGFTAGLPTSHSYIHSHFNGHFLQGNLSHVLHINFTQFHSLRLRDSLRLISRTDRRVQL